MAHVPSPPPLLVVDIEEGKESVRLDDQTTRFNLIGVTVGLTKNKISSFENPRPKIHRRGLLLPPTLGRPFTCSLPLSLPLSLPPHLSLSRPPSIHPSLSLPLFPPSLSLISRSLLFRSPHRSRKLLSSSRPLPPLARQGPAPSATRRYIPLSRHMSSVRHLDVGQ